MAPRPRADAKVVPVETEDRLARVTPAAESIDALALRAGDEDSALANPFAVMQWEAPAPKAAEKPLQTVELAPPPAAPPLPFRFLGRYVEDDKAVVFLQYKDENLVVREGDVLVEQYKVERLSHGELTLLYLPLNEHQTLELGAAID